jgi:glycine/D-amino acid oxidase-like deaminating enzyme
MNFSSDPAMDKRIYDLTAANSPSVGRTGRYKNVSYGIGHGGHGVNLTSVFGRIIAELEAGRAEPWRQYPFVYNRLY